MAIDITKMEVIRKLTLKDLVDDAVERGDMDALHFLEDESNKTETRERKDGTTYEASRNIISIRTEYLKTYLNYVPQSEKNADEKKASDKAKREKKKADMFTDAFNRIKKNKK